MDTIEDNLIYIYITEDNVLLTEEEYEDYIENRD